MNTRYVVSKIDKDGFRTMIGAVQGRNTYATPEEAQTHLDQLLSANTSERLEEVWGKQVTGTFKVSAVECWPGHNDPKGPYVQK